MQILVICGEFPPCIIIMFNLKLSEYTVQLEVYWIKSHNFSIKFLWIMV
jgi:hypothetical protein